MKDFLNKHPWSKRILILILGIGLILFLDVGCLYRRFLNFPCPGCGMTRAWSSFLTGHIKEAFYYHPLFLVVPIVFFCFIFDDKIKNKKLESAFLLTTAMLFVIVYFVRLLTHTIP